VLINVIEELVTTRFNPEDGNTTFLQNVCNQVLDNTVLLKHTHNANLLLCENFKTLKLYFTLLNY